MLVLLVHVYLLVGGQGVTGDQDLALASQMLSDLLPCWENLRLVPDKALVHPVVVHNQAKG